MHTTIVPVASSSGRGEPDTFGNYNPKDSDSEVEEVTSKLKRLKNPLHKLVYDHGNLHDRVSKLRHELEEVQKALDSFPTDPVLREEEAIYVQAFNEGKLDEERFLKQKVKIEWLEHYEMFLGINMPCDDLYHENLFPNLISDVSHHNMIHNVSDEEIKSAMFSIRDDKSQGPDGNGQILKEINYTFIALIPKVSIPSRINDYRPISCCNVIYKCISKILTNRIIEGIKEVVSDNQSAFVPGRRIYDNILITQEHMHRYHRDKSPHRCAFKIDIQKAYDTIDWRFLDSGFFEGKRGLRQGDPLSPYLFTLGIEVLTLILKRRVRASDSFRYHKHCEEPDLINVCFVDVLFIFSRGDVNSTRGIMESLEEFKSVSGLVPSLPKSTAFFCNVGNHVKHDILNIMPFSEGSLLVIYLGVPLISTGLYNRDCKFLVEKAKNRIGDWKNKSLSYAGRLQLCKSVTSSMHVYWASILMIPTGILLNIEQLIRGFLWCNGELKCGKAKGNSIRLCLIRRCSNGTMTKFSIQAAWEALRPHGTKLIAHKRTAVSIIRRLLFAASSYYIWTERNNRLFKKVKRSPDDIGDIIKVTVQLKLLFFKFKNRAK
ncbi:protein LAZ1, partial [Tanacetum coccineum]